MNSMRFTLRFRADDEEERRAAEYLKSLKHGEQNRFLVGAVLSVLGSGTVSSPANLRQVIREELAAALSSVVLFSPEQKNSQNTEAQDDLSVLEDLEMFG